MYVSLPFQVLSDFHAFLETLKIEDSRIFNNRDIVTESVEFEDNEDPTLAARQVFVRNLNNVIHV